MKKIKIMISAIALSTSLCFSAFAGDWKSDNNGWKYQNDDGSYVKNSWKEINGKWYYFNEGGLMLSDTTTPDGYAVNESGEWVEQKTATKSNSIGDKYTFESKGKWVSEGKIPEGEYVYYPGNQERGVIIDGSSSHMNNFNYIKLYKDDIINPGAYVPVSEAGELDITKEGVFLVGRDIKAGTYHLTQLPYDGSSLNMPGCSVFYEIPSSKDGYVSQRNLAYDSFVGKLTHNTVTVIDGQYVQLILCTADFVRP